MHRSLPRTSSDSQSVSGEAGRPDVLDKLRSRDEVFDVAKGVGIVAVVALHVTSRSAGLFHEPYSDGWWTLKWINLFVNFCVPLFLLISAILLARSASKQDKPDWIGFARRRLRSVILPLVVWSIIYWILRRFVMHDEHLMKPGYWFDIRARLVELFFGKAEFHLYFLSVLAQLCLVLPFFVMLYKRIRMNLVVAVLFAIVMQLAAYFLHKAWPYDYPGSILLWYLSTVLPGIWIGMNWKDWPSIRSRSWWAWIVLSVIGFAALGFETRLQLLKLPVDGLILNLAPFLYGMAAPILILALLSVWNSSESRTRVVFRKLGEMSLQIYLMHPILLEWLGKSWRLSFFQWLPLSSLWYFLVILFGTYGISLIFEWIGVLNPVLFGRDAPARERWRNGRAGD